MKRTVTSEQRLRTALAGNRATDLSTWNADSLQLLQARAPEFLKNLWTDQELTEIFASVRVDPTDGLTDPGAVPNARPAAIQCGGRWNHMPSDVHDPFADLARRSSPPMRRVCICSYDDALEHRWRWTARFCQRVRALQRRWRR